MVIKYTDILKKLLLKRAEGFATYKDLENIQKLYRWYCCDEENYYDEEDL